jgi:two-component system, OmpR family, sensor histidine kinase QseC
MSLRLRLLALISLSLTILWSLVAVWMFLNMRNELRTTLDNRLAASAHMVAGLVLQFPPEKSPLHEQNTSPMDIIAHDGIACEVSQLRGEIMDQVMARTTGSPALSNAKPGYGTHPFGGRLWRTYVLEQGGIRIATADRIDIREGLQRDIAMSVGIPFAVALTGSLIVLWFSIGRGLLPIEQVRVALAQRNPDDAAPLLKTKVPPELQPLVETIYGLLERVQGTITRERRFTDDAAHELRTPLTAIKTHLQVARLAATQSQTIVDMTQALDSADQGVLRLQNTLDQLLLLARLDGKGGNEDNALTEARLAAYQAIDDVRENLGASTRLVCEFPDTAADLRIPKFLIVSALRNLLDNALRYSPATSSVTLRIEYLDSIKICFSVIDDGPGLTETECVQALERFWRKGSTPHGNGLGLSIVSAIAKRYAGQFHLCKNGAKGLKAKLIFPRETPIRSSR